MKTYVKLLIASISGNSIAVELNNIYKAELAYGFQKMSNTSEGVVGYLNDESKLLLVDIAFLFGVSDRSISPEFRYLILEIEDEQIALVVDEINGLEDVDKDHISLIKPSESTDIEDALFTKCFLNEFGDTILILDVTKLYAFYLSQILNVAGA
jgi:chemotaxis signal transduction protein